MQGNGEEGQYVLKCSGYLKRKIDTRDGKKSAWRWDQYVYWVRLQGTKMHFFMVESMYNHGYPPPGTTVEPPREHMHKLKEEPLDVTQYWVGNLYHKRNGKRCDSTFFLELKHECRLLGCPSRCKQDGRVMERIVFQAPSEQRMRQWAVALQDVGQCAQRLLEDSLPRPSSAGPVLSYSPPPASQDPLVVQQELERIRQRLMERQEMDEHLSYMLAEISRARDILRLFHYWDKCSGKMCLVDTTRERLEAVLLKDYLLYPGAEWSRLPQGTAVLVLGKAPVGNTYCVKTMRSVVCTEPNPVKWDSGFLSVAAVEGFDDNHDQPNLEEAEPEGGAGDIFTLEIEDSPVTQGRQRRLSVSCPSSPLLERKKAPAIPVEEGPECLHEENALTIPLVGFVAGSVLDLFSGQERSAEQGGRRVSWRSSPVGSRDAEESGWSIRDFRQLWKTGDTDSIERMDLDSDQVSLPSSASNISIASSTMPEQACGHFPMDTPASSSAPGPSWTLKRLHKIRKSMGKMTPRVSESSHQPVRPVVSNPPFGEDRVLKVEVGGEAELELSLDGYDLEGEAVSHVFVTKVEPGSPAYKAGLFQGDAIYEVDGVDVRHRSVGGIQAVVAEARSVAKLEGRSAITLRVQWRHGSSILKLVQNRRECSLQLQQHQKELRVLVDREMALLAGSLQGGGLPVSEEEKWEVGSDDGTLDDVVSVVHSAVDMLRADLFVLPTSPFLLFTYESLCEPGQEAFVKGVQSVREVAGVGLRDELALLPPPRKGATVLTQPHCLRARGICHLVVGSTYRPLELACLQALEHARGVQSKQLVFAGFMCDQAKVVMRTILLYSKPDMPNMPKCVFASEAAEQARDYTTCLDLVRQQIHTTWDEGYRGDMDRLVSQQARGTASP